MTRREINRAMKKPDTWECGGCFNVFEELEVRETICPVCGSLIVRKE